MKHGWEPKRLDDVCELITCGVAARPQYIDEGIPFLSAKNVKDGKIVWNGFNCISEQTHKELTKNNKPLLGDILYTRVGSYGEAAVIEDDYEFSVFVSLTLIKVDKNILDNYFLKHYLNSNDIKKLAKKSISSSGVGNLNVGTVREFPIYLPTLSEQQRIVTILDEAFETIAKAKANAEQNLKNAKELFESVKLQIFKDLAHVDSKVPIASVCKEIFAGGDAPKENFSDEKTEKYNIPIIANAVKNNGLYGYTDLKRVNNPSITIAARGSGTGHTEIRYEPFFPIVRLIVLTPNDEIITLEFLKFSIQNLEILSSGSAIPQLTIPMIKDYSISLPSIPEQQNITQKLDVLSVETKRLEFIYKKKIKDLDELKKSILQKAFNGEL
jgi:type I restriction enzyme S subunit